MDYLSKKIKSAPKIEPTPEFHGRIMRRAFYTQFRYPLWILTIIAGLRIITDGWLLLNHSLVKVVGTLTADFHLRAASISKMGVGIIEKALLHPDLIANLAIDFILVSYIFYMMTLLRGIRRKKDGDRSGINPLVWFRYVFKQVKIIKQ